MIAFECVSPRQIVGYVLDSGDDIEIVELIPMLMCFRQLISVCVIDWAAFVVGPSTTVLSSYLSKAMEPMSQTVEPSPHQGREHVPAGLCREPDWPCWW